MAVTYQQKVIISLILVFTTTIRHTHTSTVTINTNMEQWKVSSTNDDSNKQCEKSFQVNNPLNFLGLSLQTPLTHLIHIA